MEFDIEKSVAKLFKECIDKSEIEKAFVVAKNVVKNISILNKCLEMAKVLN